MANLTKNFFTKLNKMNDKDYIECLLEYYTSLITAAVKPSVTVTILKNKENYLNAWYKYGAEFLNKYNLKSLDLKETDTGLILFIYNEDLLKTYLSDDKHKTFLRNLGYDKATSLDSALELLQERFNKYHCPHELGLFLGYPLNDVVSFMNCNKDKCLLCGYWKVFNNKASALKTFKKYDNVRNTAIIKILNKTAISF